MSMGGSMATAWVFEDGDWDEIDNPLPDMTQETLREAGYVSTPTAIFGTSGETAGFTVELYPAREGLDDERPPYEYLVLVPALTSQPVFAPDLPSVLELLAGLMPLVQGATG